MKKIEGLLAAAFTPFHEDGSLNLGLIPALVDKLVNDGLKGIFICGSNGEGPNMTTEERMKVAEEFVKAANRRLLIIVHVGHSSIAESRILAAHAAEIGADVRFGPGDVCIAGWLAHATSTAATIANDTVRTVCLAVTWGIPRCLS